MSALALSLECSGGPAEFFGMKLNPSPPRHGDCPGGHTIPGLLGGWHCSCPCHLSTGSEPAKESTQ